MTRVSVTEEDSIELALRKLRRKVNEKYAFRWYRPRRGYYEKPSTLRRKRKKMRGVVIRSESKRLWLKVGQKERFNRNGPDNSVGR
jgi:ribosomal protein S21